jgi:hypothetical protein
VQDDLKKAIVNPLGPRALYIGSWEVATTASEKEKSTSSKRGHNGVTEGTRKYNLLNYAALFSMVEK